MKNMKDIFEAVENKKMGLSEVPGFSKVFIREKGKITSVPSTKLSKMGINIDHVIGFFANKDNIASGWTVYSLTPSDKSEFGPNAKRVYSDKTETTSIVKFDLKKGTVSFLDNKAYEDGEIKYQRPSAYNRLIIDGEDAAMRAFGVDKTESIDYQIWAKNGSNIEESDSMAKPFNLGVISNWEGFIALPMEKARKLAGSPLNMGKEKTVGDLVANLAKIVRGWKQGE